LRIARAACILVNELLDGKGPKNANPNNRFVGRSWMTQISGIQVDDSCFDVTVLESIPTLKGAAARCNGGPRASQGHAVASESNRAGRQINGDRFLNIKNQSAPTP